METFFIETQDPDIVLSVFFWLAILLWAANLMILLELLFDCNVLNPFMKFRIMIK